MTVVDETTGPLIVEEDAPPVGSRLAGLADALYVTRVGGDFMRGHLLPPALAVMMPVAAVDARSWWRAALIVGVVPWAVASHLRITGLLAGPSERIVDPIGLADPLRCGALHHLKPVTTAPLTPARFVRNMRLVIQLRDFRFPSDPSAALAQFCAG